MIEVNQKVNYRVSLSDGKHEFFSDVETQAGGDDSGPSPHELLEGALGACTTQTLLMYSGRKGWNLEGMKVQIHITSSGADTHIQRKITFPESLPEEQRKRLLEIANKCPIHKILKSHIVIENA